jgi:hypothetical protein
MLPLLAAAAAQFTPEGREATSDVTDALSGKSRYQAANYTSAEGYDPNAKFVGGSREASAAMEYDRAREADRAQARQAAQANYGRANYMGDAAQAARMQQQDAAAMMRARATGEAPSIAQMQADRQMQQARAAQSSMAAGARGAAGIAMAQQQAAGNTASSQQQISGQAQIAAAQERLAAEQAYAGAVSGIRGQDLGAMGQYAQMSQAQADLQMRQRQLNDQRSAQYDQGAWDVSARNQQAAMQEQSNVAASHANAQQVNAQTAGNNAQGVQKLGQGFLGAAQGIIGGLALSDVNAKQDVTTPLALGGMSYGTGGGVMDPSSGMGAADAGGAMQANPYGTWHSSTPGASHNYSANPTGAAQPAQATQPGAGAVTSSPVMGLGSILSDERAKDRDPMLEQLSTMQPSAYRYKPGMGKDPNEQHVGPMAQNMASAPVTATAITQAPNGMLALDGEKSLKLALGGVGYLAEKQAKLERELAAKKGGR